MTSLRREAESESGLAADDLRETWRLLAPDDRLEAFLGCRHCGDRTLRDGNG